MFMMPALIILSVQCFDIVGVVTERLSDAEKLVLLIPK